MFKSTVSIYDMSAVTHEMSVGTDKMPSDEMLVDTMSHGQKNCVRVFLLVEGCNQD